MSQSNYSNIYPENILSSVKDFLKIGNKRNALEIIYKYIASKTTKVWSHDYEALILYNIDFSLLFNQPKMLDVNLQIFRNVAQINNVSSLEKVFKYLIDNQEKRFTDVLKSVQNKDEIFIEINNRNDASNFYFNSLNNE